MRNLHELDKWRINKSSEADLAEDADRSSGQFVVILRGIRLMVQASTGLGWDHVSASTSKRCPTWDEMEAIKRLFFEDDETAMQLHVAPKDHINIHPFVLHIWRPQHEKIPLPPEVFV